MLRFSVMIASPITSHQWSHSRKLDAKWIDDGNSCSYLLAWLMSHNLMERVLPPGNSWSADDDLDPLEFLDFGVTGGRHRLAQSSNQIHRPIGHRGRAEQNVLQIADR